MTWIATGDGNECITTLKEDTTNIRMVFYGPRDGLLHSQVLTSEKAAELANILLKHVKEMAAAAS